MLQTQIKITLFDKEYTLSYPTVGQKFQVESAKILFSNGIYGQLAISQHKTANELLDIIDAFSYFSVLVPDLKRQLTPQFLEQMDFLTSNQFREQFRIYYQFLEAVEGTLMQQVSNNLTTAKSAEE